MQYLGSMIKNINTPAKRWSLLWTGLISLAIVAAHLEPVATVVVEKQATAVTSPEVQVEEKVHHIMSRDGKDIPASQRQQIARTILKVAKQYQIDPLMILAIIKTESSFRTTVKSWAGAIGLMQIKPIVVKDVADEMPVSGRPAAELLRDPKSNIQVGVHYLSNLMDRFGGTNWHHVLAAYNMGPTYVSKLVRRNQQPSKKYFSKVMSNYQDYSRVEIPETT